MSNATTMVEMIQCKFKQHKQNKSNQYATKSLPWGEVFASGIWYADVLYGWPPKIHESRSTPSQKSN